MRSSISPSCCRDCGGFQMENSRERLSCAHPRSVQQSAKTSHGGHLRSYPPNADTAERFLLSSIAQSRQRIAPQTVRRCGTSSEIGLEKSGSMTIILQRLVCRLNSVMQPFQWTAIMSTLLILGGCAIVKPSHPTAVLADSQKRLATCPQSPNCVSSMETNPRQHIPPLRYTGNQDVAYGQLIGLLTSDPRVRIVTREDNYLRAEFRSSVWGFVDDVEFLFSADQPIVDVRSASRVGYYDFGVNRRRIESIRNRWSQSRD